MFIFIISSEICPSPLNVLTQQVTNDAADISSHSQRHIYTLYFQASS